MRKILVDLARSPMLGGDAGGALAPVAPHLTPPRSTRGRSATSAGPAPPARPGAGSGRSCGISLAGPGCSHRCPRWASAPVGGSCGSARLRAESGTSDGLPPGPARPRRALARVSGLRLKGDLREPHTLKRLTRGAEAPPPPTSAKRGAPPGRRHFPSGSLAPPLGPRRGGRKSPE